jgi:hypothetical protein
MVMRWFSREYVTGGLSDDEWARREDYSRHLNAIGSELGDGAEELIATVQLHDAQVQEWGTRDGDFQLRVLTGDLQRGYEELTLVYRDAELIGAAVDDFNAWRLDQPGVELVEDEVDITGDGRYEHPGVARRRVRHPVPVPSRDAPPCSAVAAALSVQGTFPHTGPGDCRAPSRARVLRHRPWTPQHQGMSSTGGPSREVRPNPSGV